METLSSRRVWQFHRRTSSGRVGARSGRLFIYGRIQCTDVPDGWYFGHSSTHGPPLDEIVMCVVKAHNGNETPKVVEWLC